MGHLLEMMQHGDDATKANEENACKLIPSETDRALELCMRLRDVPVLLGAQDCVRDGVLSSLHPQVL